MISEEALREQKKALEGGLGVDIRGGSARTLSVKSLSARVSPVRRHPSTCPCRSPRHKHIPACGPVPFLVSGVPAVQVALLTPGGADALSNTAGRVPFRTRQWWT